MGRSKTTEKLIAQELYINTNLTLQEIAQKLNVRDATISVWKKEGAWDTLKTARNITRAELIKNYYQAIANLQKRINERPYPDNVPTPAEADILSKLTTQAEKLNKSITLAQMIQVFEDYIAYLRTYNSDLVKIVSETSLNFIENKAKELQ